MPDRSGTVDRKVAEDAIAASQPGMDAAVSGDATDQSGDDLTETGLPPNAVGFTIDEPSFEAVLEHWQKQSRQDCEAYLEFVKAEKDYILKEFLDSSNDYAILHSKSQKKYTCWRMSIICMTATVAALNILATMRISGELKLVAWISILAAVVATLLAMVVNIENLMNYSQRANNFRESRELYLTHYRSFREYWTTQVIAYGPSAIACSNASLLYRRLVSVDKEAREFVKKMMVNKDD